ncbi:MAG: hypothetical protein WC615_11780 [Mucilaginibacter sp.]|jgi:hypothetical protein|uniref:hypothetical protein n=1 Tax=Mucilaginibacter sp. TaxID=1882438 RepID=UPI0035673719
MNQPKRSRCEIARKTNKPTENLTPTKIKGRKRYQIAQARSANGRQQKDNENLEIAYFNVLARVKRLLKGSNKLYFERDYRKDGSSYLAMYAFVSDSFYLYLECEFDFCYSLEFAFCNCRCEAALRELLTPLKDNLRIKEVSLKPDLTTYYKNVLAYQPEHFRYFL